MIEYRVRCAHQPDDAWHKSHTWLKISARSAVQSVIDLGHRAEVDPNNWYTGCVPYVAEMRTLGEWQDTGAEGGTDGNA